MRNMLTAWAGYMTGFRAGLCKDLAMIVLRVGFGAVMMTHGWAKVAGYSEMSEGFYDPFGLGGHVSLAMVILAEFVCAGLVVLGLLTRLASIPLVINMSVAFFGVHGADPLQKKELALLYLIFFIGTLVGGAGRFSLDGLLMKKFASPPSEARPPDAGY